jgi:hypothetical protein
LFSAFRMLRHAVFSVLRNFGAGVGFAWPWLIVLTVVAGGLSALVYQSGFGQVPEDRTRGLATFFIAVVIGLAVYLVAFASIAVNWHRYILLDDASPGLQRLRIDRHVLRYMWRAFLAVLATVALTTVPIIAFLFAVGALLLIADKTGTDHSLIKSISQLLLSAFVASFAGALFFRSALALPAVAIGRTDIGITLGWEATLGHFWGLVGIGFGSWLIHMTFQLMIFGASYAAGALGSVVSLCLLLGVAVAAAWFLTFFGMTLLTSLYGYFIEKRAI